MRFHCEIQSEMQKNVASLAVRCTSKAMLQALPLFRSLFFFLVFEYVYVCVHQGSPTIVAAGTLGMPIAAQLLEELWVGALRPFSAMRAYYGP